MQNYRPKGRIQWDKLGINKPKKRYKITQRVNGQTSIYFDVKGQRECRNLTIQEATRIINLAKKNPNNWILNLERSLESLN